MREDVSEDLYEGSRRPKEGHSETGGFHQTGATRRWGGRETRVK